ncbi:MAG: CHASE2 domain-containing protein [Cyanobacteria bacterium P01_D01_bin.56]
MTRFIFNLRVSFLKESGLCSFFLWNRNHEGIPASRLYSKSLARDYATWREQYLTYYNLSLEGELDEGGSLQDFPLGDPAQDVRRDEQQLIETFLNWLRNGEFLKLEEYIRNMLMQLIQHGSLSNSVDETSHIDIYLACDEVLEKLPWEAWVATLIPDQLPKDTIRLIRTCEGKSIGTHSFTSRLSKSRILAILAADNRLSVSDDWDVLKSLRPTVFLDRVEILLTDSAELAAQKLCDALVDDRGWDVIYFAGHSDESAVPGGMFSLSPTVKLSIRDIKDYLEKARQNGLQLAIFNSCCGVSIARALTELNIQSVVMRETVHDDVANSFLQRICEYLRQSHDVLTATLSACQDLTAENKIKLPSASFIPIFFSPRNLKPFRIKKASWRNQLKQWQPTKKELSILVTAWLISIFPPTASLLLESRTFSQALFRDWTNQVDRDISDSPVILIEIDQDSIDKSGLDDFETIRIDQRYLAKILEEIPKTDAQTIGINYILDQKRKGKENLESAISTLTEDKEISLVFGVNNALNLKSKFANQKLSLEGDVRFWPRRIRLPSEADCNNENNSKVCPFSYLLSTLSWQGKNISPDETSHLIMNHSKKLFRGSPIIDFSLPPKTVYNRLPAWKLIEEDVEIPGNQVVIISSGGYADSLDGEFMPWAVNYWENPSFELIRNPAYARPDIGSESSSEFQNKFGSGDAQAYMVHHFKYDHLIFQIPSIWVILLGAIFGKGIQVFLIFQDENNRKKLIFFLGISIFLSGLAKLQIYILLSLCIPWLFPTSVLMNYALFSLRGNKNVKTV